MYWGRDEEHVFWSGGKLPSSFRAPKNPQVIILGPDGNDADYESGQQFCRALMGQVPF